LGERGSEAYNKDLVNPKHTSTSTSEVLHAITTQSCWFGGCEFNYLVHDKLPERVQSR